MADNLNVIKVVSLSINELMSCTSIDQSNRLYQAKHWEPQLVSINATREGLITHVSKSEGLHTIFSKSLPLEILVDSFVSMNRRHRISPALVFRCEFDSTTSMFEMNGAPPYEDILVYGETIKEAWDVLDKEILPILWEEYVNGDDIKLSPKAKEIKLDLETRVEK